MRGSTRERQYESDSDSDSDKEKETKKIHKAGTTGGRACEPDYVRESERKRTRETMFV